MTLNLKDPRAVKIVHQLLAEYMVIIEQFRPGVMASSAWITRPCKKTIPALSTVR